MLDEGTSSILDSPGYLTFLRSLIHVKIVFVSKIPFIVCQITLVKNLFRTWSLFWTPWPHNKDRFNLHKLVLQVWESAPAAMRLLCSVTFNNKHRNMDKGCRFKSLLKSDFVQAVGSSYINCTLLGGIPCTPDNRWEEGKPALQREKELGYTSTSGPLAGTCTRPDSWRRGHFHTTQLWSPRL